MAVPISDDLRRVLDQRAVAHVATVGRDGWPHVTAMWIGRDGDHLLLNTAEGRVKWHNMRRDPRVSISLSPRNESYNYSIKGRVVEMRTSDGDEVIDALARKYTKADRFSRPAGQIRVTILVEPLHIAGGPQCSATDPAGCGASHPAPSHRSKRPAKTDVPRASRPTKPNLASVRPLTPPPKASTG